MEHYENLTYKATGALKWIKEFCPNVDYLLKADEDVFVHVPGILEYLEQNAKPSDRFFYCHYYDDNKMPIGRPHNGHCGKW